MKTQSKGLFIAFVLIHSLNVHPTTAHAQGTAFTYQGRLNDGTSPANGRYDLQFGLFNQSALGNPVAPILTNANIAVTGGLFTTMLDFGAGIFTGTNYWLEIAVRTNGNGAFAVLNPRQPLTATPYALMATSASNLLGSLPSTQVSGSVNAATLGGLSNSNFWKVGGNSGTSDNFIGTTDNTTFNIRVNNVRAMRYELNADAGGTWTNAPNIVGGSPINFVEPATVGATIGGGGGNDSPASGFASPNIVTADFGTIGGGLGNTADYDATVAGGVNNTASGLYATVGGGHNNTASGNYATVNGGDQNNANNPDATISGGYNNTASGSYATVTGGYHNTAGGDYSTIGGGNQNIANGDYSFAAGNYARAQNNGAFVWSDASAAVTFSSTTANQFRVRATGGVAFVTAINVDGSVNAGVHLLSGDTAWSSISDKNAKKNFRPVDGEAVLQKLASIPVEQWNYKWESDTNTPHIGPMAQDFKAAFYPGRDDKSISTLEFDGVELAAIQGLNRKLEEQLSIEDAQMKAKDSKIQELEQRLERLERAIQK